MKKNARLTEAKPSAHQQAHSTIPAAPAAACRVRGVWILKLTCPYCGKTHTHGGGDGPVPDGGHREAHCLKPPRRGYIIEVAAEYQQRGAV